MRECVNCQNYVPAAPSDWKPPDYSPHASFDIHDLRSYLFRLKQTIGSGGWPGRCHAEPASIEVRSNHFCARWVLNLYMLMSWDEFMQPALYRRDIEGLQRKLKDERARSLDRFHRLRQVTHKTKANGEAMA